MNSTLLEIIKAIGSVVGPCIGVIFGFLIDKKMTEYRLEQVEKKQTSLTEKQTETGDKVVTLEIKVGQLKTRVDDHDTELNNHRDQIKRLEDLQLKK